MILLKDNSEVSKEYEDNPIIAELIDRDLNDLEIDNFIIFPANIKESVDLESNNYLFKNHNRKIFTSNLIGFLKKGKYKIKINSRFYECDNENINHINDYFVQYLLQKVMNVNIINNKANTNSEFSYYDLLAFLFPMYLDDALKKGVYKEYVNKSYNDANIKGPINIARHIKSNTPFIGRIAYSTREFDYDNKITQLIRHTIEKLKLEYSFDAVFNNELKDNIRNIINSTPSYSRLNRLKIVEENILNPFRHSYFEGYYELQKLCIQILNEEKIGFGDEDDEVYGIIIDVAWLWEEYLATLLTPNYVHSENKTRKNPIYFYENKTNPRYPDFYSNTIILDAKYKRLDIVDKGGISREDLYQLTSYLHVREAEKSGLIFPSKIESKYQSIGVLAGYGGEIFKISFMIPQNIDEYSNFVKEMNNSEEIFLHQLKENNI